VIIPPTAADAGLSTSRFGTHRVLEPAGVLPQAAWRLDPSPPVRADEVLVRVERLNLDAASFRQLAEAHGHDGEAVRAAVLDIVESRGKMHNPVTGSGGMLLGTVAEVGPDSPLGLAPGDRIATLVSLTLTPLAITDGLSRWDGRCEQVPCDGTAILFGRSIAARLPVDIAADLALAVLDVCGAPALVARVVAGRRRPRVLVLGAAGKSGSLALAAAREHGAGQLVGLVPTEDEGRRLTEAGLADRVVLADARDPLAVASAVGAPADVTVVCVDVPGCEGGAILATATGGSVVFFSMASSLPAAALTAEGLGADVELLIGNGYVPGHAEMALELFRNTPGVRQLFKRRLDLDSRARL
jgi:L-erythro-3,5-diaminohexanoate dehydrogenase